MLPYRCSCDYYARVAQSYETATKSVKPWQSNGGILFMAADAAYTILFRSEQLNDKDEYLLASMRRLTYVAAISGTDKQHSIVDGADTPVWLILRRARSSAG